MISSGKQRIEKFPGTLLVKSKLKYIQVSIKGNSMSPTFKNGDFVIFEKNNGANLKINDIVLFNHPFRNNKKIIKRIKKIMQNGCIFVEGDNRHESEDSHHFGTINKNQVIATFGGKKLDEQL